MSAHIKDGLSEFEQFYLNLGSAISTWQDVEVGLLDVFHRVSGTSRHIAQAILLSVISFEARHSMTNATATVALDGSRKLREWNALSERVGDNQETRNRLAHFSLTQASGKNPKSTFMLFLVPNVLNALNMTKYAARRPPHYNLAHVKEAGDSFAKLGADLTSFAASLGEA